MLSWKYEISRNLCLILYEPLMVIHFNTRLQRLGTNMDPFELPIAVWPGPLSKSIEFHCDVFEIEPALSVWKKELFGLIDNSPHLNWQLLTKIPENVLLMVPDHW